MIIHQKLGKLNDFILEDRCIDLLPIEWYETNKRILHKQTNSGKPVVIKFLNQSPNLMQDDVIFADEHYIVCIDIQPCDAIIIQPASMQQMAAVCYEIGNKHLPLFLHGDEVLVPYEAPLFRMLIAAGLNPLHEERKLLHPVRTTVSPHSHSGNGSLFSKILQLTNSTSHG